MSPPSIPAREFPARRRRLAEAAAARDLAGVLVWSLGGASADWYGDVMYLTNHHAMMPHIPRMPESTAGGYSAVVISETGDDVLVTTTLDDPDDRIQIDDIRQTRHLPQAVAEVIHDKGLAGERLGLVGRETMLSYVDQLLHDALGPGTEFEPCDDLLEGLRMIKSPAELDALRYAAGVGARWMASSLGAIVEGATEGDIVGEGVRELMRSGGVPYDVAIASGNNAHHYWGSSGIPHWNCDRPLVAGDLVHCDVWGPVNGYYTDFARSTVVGRPPTEPQREVLEGAVGVVEAIIAQIRPGVTFGDLYRTGSDWLDAHGFGTSSKENDTPQFHEIYPSFGHCIGLGIENPELVAGQETRLEANMVVAVETLIGRPGVGAANFEHNVIVLPDGYELLTQTTPSKPWE